MRRRCARIPYGGVLPTSLGCRATDLWSSLLCPLFMPLGCGRTWRRATVFCSRPFWGSRTRSSHEKKADQSWSVASGGSCASRGQVIGFDARPGSVRLTIASAWPFRVLCCRDCAILCVVSSVLLRGHVRVLGVRSGSVCGTIASARPCRVQFSRDCAIVGRVRTHGSQGSWSEEGSQPLRSQRVARYVIIACPEYGAGGYAPLAEHVMRTRFSLIFSIIFSSFSACDGGLAGVCQRTVSRFRRYTFAICCTFRVLCRVHTALVPLCSQTLPSRGKLGLSFSFNLRPLFVFSPTRYFHTRSFHLRVQNWGHRESAFSPFPFYVDGSRSLTCLVQMH